MNNPLVSIIIPTYNRAHLISETLDSVLAQTYTNWECIIVDDGSTDNSAEVIRAYVSKDIRFQCHERPKDRLKGGNAARNYGFEMSRGKYVNWFDSDDLMTSTFLEDKMQVFLSNPTLDAVLCPGAYFVDLKEPLHYTKKITLSENPIFDFVKNDLFFAVSSPLWNKYFLDSKVLFDQDRIKIQDIDFHFRMLLKQPNFVFLQDKYNILIRRTSDSISKSVMTEEKLLDVFRHHYNTFCAFNYINDDIQIQYKYVTSKKVLQNYYAVLKYNNSIFYRIQCYKNNRKIIKNVIDKSSKNNKHKLSRFFVIFFVTIFGKGFKFIN